MLGGGFGGPRTRSVTVPVCVAILAALVWIGPATPNDGVTGFLAPAPQEELGLDMAHYLDVADRIAAGQLPYRDFAFEYPPLSVPVVAVPRLLSGEPDGYRAAFGALAGVLVVATAVAASLAARRLGGGEAAQLAAGGLVALGPALLGGALAAERLDLLPTACVAGAALAATARRDSGAAALLGLGVAAKLWPLALLAPFVVLARRRAGGAGARRFLLAFALALCIPLLVAAAISPSGLADAARYQFDRPLQIEASGATLLLIAAKLGIAGPYAWASGYGSINLAGGASVDVMAFVTSAALALCVGVAWAAGGLRVWRATDDRAACELAMRTAFAATVALVVFAKVLSPQFMLWLLPLPLLIGRGRWTAAGLIALALLLTRLAVTGDYFAYALRFETAPLVLLAARDLALAAALAIALAPLLGLSRAPPARSGPTVTAAGR